MMPRAPPISTATYDTHAFSKCVGICILCLHMFSVLDMFTLSDLTVSPIYPLQDNKDLYAEEAAAQRERERQRMLTIPGLIAPNEIQDEMLDS